MVKAHKRVFYSKYKYGTIQTYQYFDESSRNKLQYTVRFGTQHGRQLYITSFQLER